MAAGKAADSEGIGRFFGYRCQRGVVGDCFEMHRRLALIGLAVGSNTERSGYRIEQPAARRGPSSSIQETTNSHKDAIEHSARESAGLRILLAWVVRGNKNHITEPMDSTVSKWWAWPRDALAGPRARRQIAIQGDLAQCDDDSDVLEQSQFTHKVGLASLDLWPQGFVVRGCAAHHRRDVSAGQPQAVVAIRRMRLIGKSGAV